MNFDFLEMSREILFILIIESCASPEMLCGEVSASPASPQSWPLPKQATCVMREQKISPFFQPVSPNRPTQTAKLAPPSLPKK